MSKCKGEREILKGISDIEVLIYNNLTISIMATATI